METSQSRPTMRPRNSISSIFIDFSQPLMDGRINGWTDGWTDRRMDGRKDGRTEGRKDGRTEGRMEMTERSLFKEIPRRN